MEVLAEGGLTNLCRLCGEDSSECLDLFDQESQGSELLSKIELSVRIAITEGDGLPSGICGECQDKLLGYTSFYQQCHDTQERLQEFLSIESAIYKTELNDYDEGAYIYEEAEVVLEEGVDCEEGFVEADPADDHEQEAEEEYGIQTETKGGNDSDVGRSDSERLMASPVSIVVEDLQFIEPSEIMDLEGEDSQCQQSPDEKPKKKLVYLVKNASHIPVESVLSAVLGTSEPQSVLSPSHKEKKHLGIKRKHPPEDKLRQKVVIKGSDGKENMIFLDLSTPTTDEVPYIKEEPGEVDDPTWAPSNTDRTHARNSSWSKLKRARTAVRNSMKILRLPKPLKKRDVSKDDKFRKSIRKQMPIGKDDPNYAVMMEKFAKPVSISTLKRHGLYQPKNGGYKINAPYKKDVAPYIEKLSDTEFRCKICLTATFRWNYKAEIHILEHLDWRPFECDVCGRAFTQNQYLTKHKRLHYPEDTNFMCEVCGKGFQRRYYLTYHMDEHFDRTYSCQECGRKFSRRQKHDEHVRYHHKCHYSICDICGQTLRTTALSRHRKQHGEKSQARKKRERSFEVMWMGCDICGRAFRSLKERDDHKAEHDNSLLPFQCEECVVYFKTVRSLNSHRMRCHSQIPEEECEVAIQEEECEVATRVLDELSTTIVVSIPGEI
ncbi:hypothetical protein ONE63_009207 [Megalurothrips usitatus]|uniref:Uncharacterized protein n=1 Tax=Megalurothrips usitatus TaxID=439358 RepID=A0AAV7XN24_9NEOP|nr:hypothetical protein ONE63_009207 [Megalurothrips usitatus]